MALSSAVGTVFILIPAIAAARTRGANDNNSTTTDTHFDAPPLAVGNIIVHSLLLVATIVQLSIVVRALFHRSIRLPASGVVTALIMVGISYSFGLAFVVARYTFDSMGHRNLFDILHLQVASIVFFDLKDLAMYAAIALVLRHRYLSGNSSASVYLGLISTACVLLVSMLAFIAANTGVFETAIRSRETGQISFQEAASRLNTSNNLFYVFVAFDVVTVLFLAVSAFLVKAHSRDDKIMTWMLFGIVPLLLLYAAARIVFAILATRLPLSDFSTIDPDFLTVDVVLRLDLAATLVFGVLYFLIMTVLVFILSRSRLWSAQPPRDAPCAQIAPMEQVVVPRRPQPQHPTYPEPLEDADVPAYSPRASTTRLQQIMGSIPQVAALPM